LAAKGLRDDEIAERLNAEGLGTGRDKSWDLTAVRWARRHEGIARTAPDAPRAHPLAERDSRGRYSIAGAAHRYDVSPQVVRRWLEQGVVDGTQEPYGSNSSRRYAWWVTIQDEDDERLLELARQSRAFAAKRRKSL
jgi:hypothetical protein